jgi:hypothetical protein
MPWPIQGPHRMRAVGFDGGGELKKVLRTVRVEMPTTMDATASAASLARIAGVRSNSRISMIYILNCGQFSSRIINITWYLEINCYL